jgi:hypothetical protein
VLDTLFEKNPHVENIIGKTHHPEKPNYLTIWYSVPRRRSNQVNQFNVVVELTLMTPMQPVDAVG